MDGTQETNDILRARIKSLEWFLIATRTDILDALHDLDSRAQDEAEDPLALQEEFGVSAIEYLRGLEKSIATYTGDLVSLK